MVKVLKEIALVLLLTFCTSCALAETTGERNALRSANSYLSFQPFPTPGSLTNSNLKDIQLQKQLMPQTTVVQTGMSKLQNLPQVI